MLSWFRQYYLPDVNSLKNKIMQHWDVNRYIARSLFLFHHVKKSRREDIWDHIDYILKQFTRMGWFTQIAVLLQLSNIPFDCRTYNAIALYLWKCFLRGKKHTQIGWASIKWVFYSGCISVWLDHVSVCTYGYVNCRQTLYKLIYPINIHKANTSSLPYLKPVLSFGSAVISTMSKAIQLTLGKNI